MTNDAIEDERVYGVLSHWDYASNKWVAYTAKELSILVSALQGQVDSKQAELERVKKDIVYRLNTIIGDYD